MTKDTRQNKGQGSIDRLAVVGGNRAPLEVLSQAEVDCLLAPGPEVELKSVRQILEEMEESVRDLFTMAERLIRGNDVLFGEKERQKIAVKRGDLIDANGLIDKVNQVNNRLRYVVDIIDNESVHLETLDG